MDLRDDGLGQRLDRHHHLGAAGEQNAQVRLAKANVRESELNLEFTKVLAPVDGYVTNLSLRLGSRKYAGWKQFLDNAYWSVELK